MDINESVLIAEFIQQDQGLPISLVPNKPFNLTLADLLWIDPDTDPAPATPFKKSLSLPNSTLISSPIRHKDDTSSSTSLSSPHAESFSISFFLSEESYQTFSSLPPFVPSIPLEMECPVASLPTSNKPIKTTEDEKTPLPSFVKENPIETKTGPSGKRESSTSSSSLPAFSNSFRPTPNLPTATITPLADPRLLNRTTSVLMKTSHPPLECPSPPTSSNDSSPTLNTPNPSKPITLPENNPSLHSLSSHKHPTTNANPNITPAPSRSSIDQLYSLYHGKTSESDRNHFPQFYTKLMRTEHELYLRLEEKKTHFSLNEQESATFEALQVRVEKEREEYTNYIKSILFQSSARYLHLKDSVEKVMHQFLFFQQKRRCIYPSLYVSKKSWNPLLLHKELKTPSISVEQIGTQKKIFHTPVNISQFESIPLPFDFRPDFAKLLPPMSKDPNMAQLISHLPEVQFMLSSGTFSKLVRLYHDIDTRGSSSFDLLFPITIHQRVVCLDKPFSNKSSAPRDLLQKYFTMTLRSLSNQHAPSSCQFSTYRLGPYKLLLRTQMDAPSLRVKCNVEYVPEIGFEAMDPNVLAGYTLKEQLGVRIHLVRFEASSGQLLETCSISNESTCLPYIQELFQFLLTLMDGHYILATRPDDVYLYILEHRSQAQGPEIRLDLRAAHIQVSSMPCIRMLEWKHKSGQIPYTFGFQSNTHLPSSSKRFFKNTSPSRSKFKSGPGSLLPRNENSFYKRRKPFQANSTNSKSESKKSKGFRKRKKKN